MDEFKSVQAEPQVQFNKPSFWGSLWGKLIIFLALVILLAAALVALNYFHILPLSQKFPFLSSLPTKQIQTIKQDNNIAQSSSTTSPYPYDSQKAEALLLEYIHQNLRSDYIPTKIEVKHKLSSANRQDDTDYTYGAYWEQQQLVFHAFLHFNPRSSEVSDLQLLIESSTVPPKIDTVSSSEVVAEYFLKHTSNIKCDSINSKTQICESFNSTNPEKKSGLGLIGPLGSQEAIVLLFSCEIPQKSSKYNWITCLQPTQSKKTQLMNQ